MSEKTKVIGKYREKIFDSETTSGIKKISAIRIHNLNAVIVFGSGCFDIAQPGHPIFTEQMRKIGEEVLAGKRITPPKTKVVVVIGVGRDSTLRALKREPICPQINRAYMLSSYKDVDFVILDGEKIEKGKIDFHNVLKILKPDVFVLNNDDSAIMEKQQLCENIGILFKTVKRIVPDFLVPTSSTQIIEKIKSFKE